MSVETIALISMAVLACNLIWLIVMSTRSGHDIQGALIALHMIGLVLALALLEQDTADARIAYQSCINHELLALESTHDEASTACRASNRSAK